MTGVGAPWPIMGSSPERKGRGKGKGERGRSWGCHGGHGEGLLGAARPPLLHAASLFGTACCTWGKKAGRRKEKRRKRKGRKKKKKMEKISNLKIFREKNKRQYMKLVKIIFFVKERYMPNYK
jgi:hypothetical protein